MIDWIARRQPTGDYLVFFRDKGWIIGRWPRISARPELQRHGWTFGQAAFRYNSEDLADISRIQHLVAEAFPSATITDDWIFINRGDYALIKLAAP